MLKVDIKALNSFSFYFLVEVHAAALGISGKKGAGTQALSKEVDGAEGFARFVACCPRTNPCVVFGIRLVPQKHIKF